MASDRRESLARSAEAEAETASAARQDHQLCVVHHCGQVQVAANQRFSRAPNKSERRSDRRSPSFQSLVHPGQACRQTLGHRNLLAIICWRSPGNGNGGRRSRRCAKSQRRKDGLLLARPAWVPTSRRGSLLVAGNAAMALDCDGTGSVGDDGFGTKTKSLSAFASQFERQHSIGATHLSRRMLVQHSFGATHLSRSVPPTFCAPFAENASVGHSIGATHLSRSVPPTFRGHSIGATHLSRRMLVQHSFGATHLS
jgi:hypothetical protein